MAFIGTPLDTRNTFQSLAGKRFNGDGSTTAFTLDVAPSSTLDIEVFVGNVRQDPNSAYTLSGTTLTFTGAPPSGTNNIYVVHQAKSVGTIDVPSGGVQSGSLASAFLTGATDIGAGIADADLLLVDDGAGGTLRKTTASRLKTYIGDNTPAFDVRLTSNQTIANNTFTKLAFATETLDSDGKFASNKFTPTIAGYYFLTYSIYYDVVDDNELLSLKVYKNGSGDNATERNNFATGTNNDIMTWGTYLIYLDTDDYIELYTKQTSGGNATAYTGNTTFSGFRVLGI